MPSPVWNRRDRLFAVAAGKTTDDSTWRDLILASAYLHATPPGADGRILASCSRVLRRALMAAGLWEEGMNSSFLGEDGGSVGFRVVDEWYRALIALTRQGPESERLLEGRGNLGDATTG